MKQGENMIALAKELWPINRSLTGQGVRETLAVLSRELQDLEIRFFETGDVCSDWTIPMEWNVREAYIIDPSGNKVCDWSNNNLHLVGYSMPVNLELTLDELGNHLYSLENQPQAIPYVTSYYKENWGFSISHEERKKLGPGIYKVTIDSTLEPGKMDFGELFIQGKSEREILFSTYICHPSMANNELSGPVLATELARFVGTMDPYYSYRFLFIPETIGSIAYISRNLSELKKNLLAGFVLTCVGDERAYSYLPSRKGGTVADKAVLEILKKKNLAFVKYSWSDRGSDERQYCAPGVDLPVCSVMRSKYGEYIEYHTSLDVIGSVVTAGGLQGSFDFYKSVIEHLENLRFPRILSLGEPQLGRRGLYPNTSMKGVYSGVRETMDAISYMDGTVSIEEISSMVGTSCESLMQVISTLEKEGLVSL
jgi:aminopeptidase-like protein